MKAKPRSTSPKRALLLLGALLLLALFLLSCDDVEDDDPKFSVAVFAGDASAGFADGKGTAAQFNKPEGLTVTPDGTIYVADTNNNRIRKLTTGGAVSTLAGQFLNPTGIAITPDGTFYVTNAGRRISKLTVGSPVSIFAGSLTTAGFADAQGRGALFSGPTGIALSPDHKTFYIADVFNHRIRKMTVTGAVSTLAGDGNRDFADGKGTMAQFNQPYGVAVASDGSIYVTDTYNNRIRKSTPDGTVTTIAGDGTSGATDGQGTAARFNSPQGIAVTSGGTVYVADTENNSIRKVTSDGAVTTIAKDLNRPKGIALSPNGSTAYVAAGNQILKLSNL